MRDDSSNVLVAFLLGTVVGGVTALLLAPSSGEETRRKLSEGLRKAKDKAFDELGQAREFADLQKEAIKEAYAQGRQAYQKTVKKQEPEGEA